MLRSMIERGLSAFAKERRSLFLANPIERCVFVCGNEAGDLDSTISSFSFAYLNDHYQGKPLIPFANISNPKIFQMRGEIQYVLGQNGINPADFLIMKEVLGRVEKEDAEIELILVDHNEIAGHWRKMFPTIKYKVLSIIDHHEDSKMFKNAHPRVIYTCGSTCSLIADLFRSNKHVNERACDDLKSMLAHAIIFDTVNLTWRNTPVDELAITTLLGPDHKMQGAQILKDLEEAIDKTPESKFGIYDLLHKDYKFYLHFRPSTQKDVFYGISTLHRKFRDMIGRDELEQKKWISEVWRFMDHEGLEILLMTDSIREKGSILHTSELGIFARSQTLTDGIYQVLQENGAQLQEIFRGDRFGLFYQGNISISRKQLHPIMKKFMASAFK